MNEIKILSDRIIIDGHANTREQCETATMLANLLLAQGSGFNCVEYRSGYAEFKKSDVAKLADDELKFVPAICFITINWDSNITKVVSLGNEFSNGVELKTAAQDGSDYTFEVTLNSGYVLDTVTLSSSDTAQGVLKSQTDTSFVITAGSGGITQTITLTSKSAAFDGKINITKSAGVVLKTEGKYCDQDITVVPTLEEKSVTPTESAQEIVPSDGNCGISKLNVGAVQTETKTITPTTSQQTFTPTSGKYFKQVICQAIQAYQGTATPAKGEQTITPTSGKFFSSFKVGAIPSDYIIPSGTLQITANGAKDVTNYKNVNVNVEPNLEQKTVTITTNGTTEVTPTSGKDGISKITVTTNVPTSPIEEVATASAMDALLVEANVEKYYKFTGTTDSNYTNGDLYLVEGGAVSSHTLTFTKSSDGTLTVNGNNVTSPYTLQNGDVIKVGGYFQSSVTINGTTYTPSYEGVVVNIENQDITISMVGSDPTVDTDYLITINYTA